MNKMLKRIIFIIFVIGAFAPNVSSGGWKMGSTEACFRQNSNNFYYCGQQTLGCAYRKDGSSDKRKWYYNGDIAKMDSVEYWCCGGTHSSMGKFQIKKDDESFYTDTTTQRKDLGNGAACMQTIKKNVCGVWDIVKDCTEPDAKMCETGTIYSESTQSCVALCQTGYAYASATSDKCVECPSTNYQAIIDSVCIKCNEASQFFVYDASGDSGSCVSKSDTTKFNALSKSDLQYGPNGTSNTSVENQCWTKTDSYDYKNCVLGRTQTLPANINRAISQTYN